MEAEKQKRHNGVIDILRIIAILAVILIHTTTKTIAISDFDITHIPFTLFLNQAARFAVPLFFMISGFVLELSYPFHASYVSYLKKRLGRIFIPYVFWSAIYYFFIYTKNHGTFFMALLQGSASYQLYFIPALLIFYTVFPLIHNYYPVFSKKRVLVVLGAVQILSLYYYYYVSPLKHLDPFHTAALNYYVFLLGIVLSHNTSRFTGLIEKWKKPLFFSTALFAGYLTFEAGSLYMKTHNYLSIYLQWRPSVLIYTVIVAGSLYEIFNRNIANSGFVKLLSRLSFFVFFVHVIILETLWQYAGADLFKLTKGAIAQNPLYDVSFFFSVAVISFIIAYFAHKIPYLSKLTG